ncbi:hypothetical protein PIB30_066116 [Stylosanthes scabra]|uniref:Uncharacterized protein n=1 Tax=Stylosanthes scabra TaxID=79078 RepID=A0ABU6ULN8_9FABA|nr:hypothetical protein [Stylosanthes scabra]
MWASSFRNHHGGLVEKTLLEVRKRNPYPKLGEHYLVHPQSVRDGRMIEVHEAYPLPATDSFHPVSPFQIPPTKQNPGELQLIKVLLIQRRRRAQHIVGHPPIDKGQFTRNLNHPRRWNHRLLVLRFGILGQILTLLLKIRRGCLSKLDLYDFQILLHLQFRLDCIHLFFLQNHLLQAEHLGIGKEPSIPAFQFFRNRQTRLHRFHNGGSLDHRPLGPTAALQRIAIPENFLRLRTK